MPYYADNLISFFYPVKVRVEGKWPYLEVITNKRYSRFCIGLLEPNQTFSGYYLSMFDPTKLGEDFSQYVVPEFKAHVQAHAEPPDKYEVIRAGDYGRFPGAKELLFKEKGCIDVYKWRLLIPVGNRLVEVSASLQTKDYEDIEGIWIPLITSLKFTPEDADEILNPIDHYEADDREKYDWTKPSPKKKQQFSYSFDPEFSAIALYDSSVRMLSIDEDNDTSCDLDDASDGYNEFGDFTDELNSNHFAKYDQRLIVRPFCDDPDIPITFSLDVKEPSPKNWYYVIEGLLGIDSGKLYANEGVGVTLEIKMKPGVYKFRIYFGRNSDDNECWNVYFNHMVGIETNEVKIIKPYGGQYFK